MKAAAQNQGDTVASACLFNPRPSRKPPRFKKCQDDVRNKETQDSQILLNYVACRFPALFLILQYVFFHISGMRQSELLHIYSRGVWRNFVLEGFAFEILLQLLLCLVVALSV